ncbi:MAG: NCS2 family permease [Deltaproteobacteria bacterium]|nr:NCS2 family permease [Deltaproteobacteria bacterium]
MSKGMLELRFAIEERGSSSRREVLGGLTTFLTMAYIAFVNPAILSAGGMPREGAFLATCLAAAVGCLLMGLLANLPVALAPGMGLNAFFAFGICLGAGVPWQTALGIVFWSGVLFLLLTVTGARRAIVKAIPKSLRFAAAAGIGLFLALIGLEHAGLVIDHPVTLVTLASPTSAPILVALFGLAVGVVLMARGVITAVFWSLLASTLLALILGVVPLPEAVLALPTGSLPGAEIDLLGALKLQYLPLIFVVLFFDVFDTLGTLLGVSHEAGLLDEEGELPVLDRAMGADAGATLAGALLGTSTVTSYIESGAGVAVGARTGLAALVTGAAFLLLMPFAPLAAVVGAPIEGGLHPVTAPALILVGVLMARTLAEIPWKETLEGVPAFFTVVLMPLTFNITHGLAAGIVCWAGMRLVAGRGREVHWVLYLICGLIVLRYALLAV